MALILLDGVPREQLVSPVEYPISFEVAKDIDPADHLAWQENVKVASAVVSAQAARDALAIEKAMSVMCGAGTFEVLVVLLTSSARKLERHVSWFSEALRCTEPPATGVDDR